MKKKITYAKSGVNIDEGNLFVKKIQPFVKRTLSKNTIGNTTSFAALYSLDLKNINNPVLVSCAAGGRSLIAANLLEQEGYTALNISDGFSGNGQDPGWKNSGLPVK